MSQAICQVCHKAFYVKPIHLRKGWGKFCSKTCQFESQKKGKNVQCLICGTAVYKSPKELKASKSKNYFCTKSCQTQWRNKVFRGELHGNWVAGESTYRKVLIESSIPRLCFICKTKDIRVLCAHHIDHNRSNNDVKNLAWLCLNCHYLVHHDGELDEKMRKSLL